MLHLVNWSYDLGCIESTANVREAWVKVLSLPVHFWSHNILKRTGDGYGGFVAID